MKYVDVYLNDHSTPAFVDAEVIGNFTFVPRCYAFKRGKSALDRKNADEIVVIPIRRISSLVFHD